MVISNKSSNFAVDFRFDVIQPEYNNNDATEKITLQNVDMDHIDVIDERKLANNFSAIVLPGSSGRRIRI